MYYFSEAMSKKFMLNVKEDENGDLYLTFPDEVIDSLGWQEGDVVEYVIDEDSFIIKKIEE
jgi:bifunctional DNA-binding transcriptional regulator/antitoxin component of YhaV-PrlF toxin-antitoxin module